MSLTLSYFTYLTQHFPSFYGRKGSFIEFGLIKRKHISYFSHKKEAKSTKRKLDSNKHYDNENGRFSTRELKTTGVVRENGDLKATGELKRTKELEKPEELKQASRERKKKKT